MSPRHVLTAVLVASAGIALSGTTADPDLWGHVRFGQDIIASHGLPRADTYSFTSDRPWINHEWLAEVVMAAAFRAGGAGGLNLLRVTIIALVLGLAWSRLKDVEPSLRLQMVAATGLGVLLRVHPIRPQLFSVLLFAVMLWLITRSEERNSTAPIAFMPLVMAAWANLHGGWIIGLGTLGFWIAGRLAFGSVPPRHRVRLALLGAAALLSTALNPYGVELWRFLGETVRADRPLISDWQPMYALPPGFAVLWLIPAGIAILALARAGRSIDRTHLGLVILLGVAALRVSRLDAFFTLTAVFFLGPLLARPGHAAGAAASPRAGRLGLAAASLAVLCVGAWQLPRVRMPVSSPEPEVAQYVRDQRLEGRMLTWFDWGEYAIWHFSPRILVSIDGRRETVYTDEVTASHMRFYAGAAGAEDYPDEIGADYIWLPRELPVVPRLRVRGWRAAFEGPVSVLLTRSAQLREVRSASLSGHRMFPDM